MIFDERFKIYTVFRHEGKPYVTLEMSTDNGMTSITTLNYEATDALIEVLQAASDAARCGIIMERPDELATEREVSTCQP